MSYSFSQGDDSVAAGFRRIALDQIDAALAEAADDHLPMGERIHQVRKRCKKLRALIRLVRPAFSDYSDENAAFRDAARRLSDVRDAAALVETADAICAHFADQLAEAPFDGLRDALVEEARARETADDVAERLDRTVEDLRAARDRAVRWQIDATGAAAIAGGLKKTYARARDAMAAAQDEPSGERLHEWRKRVKYHWYHLRLLKKVAPMIAAEVEPADALSDVLGDHHDLHVMEHEIAQRRDAMDPAAAEAALGLVAARKARLEAEAFRLGRALLTEKPGALARRVGAYWSVWRETAH